MSFSLFLPKIIRRYFSMISFRCSISFALDVSSLCCSISLAVLARSPAPSALPDRAHRDPATEQKSWPQYAMKESGKHAQNPHEYRGITLINHTAISGVHVLCGRRQSMPSSSIESCARVRQTVPSVPCGQMNRPLSRRLAKRQRPSPSNHKSFTMSPLRPRKYENVAGERLLVAARSAPAHSARRSRAAYPSHRRRSRSSFL